MAFARTKVAPKRRPPKVVKPQVDVVAVIEHLMEAVGHLSRVQGSPPEVLHALDQVRALLGKEG